MRMLSRCATVLALATLAAGSLLAQAAEKIEVVLIEVPVTVADRNGNSVKGLSAENFEILDEGKPRAVTHFEAIDLAAPMERTERPAINPAARRNFLLVFDLSYSSPGTLERASQAAREFIQRGLSPRDLAGVATFSVESGFRWVTAFTPDRRTLLQAVEAAGFSRMIKAADPLLLSITDATGPDTSPTVSGERTTDIEESKAEIARRNKRSDEEIQRARIRHQLEQFGRLARLLDRVRGQKQVILLSEGFDAQLLQGRDVSARSEDDADFAASLHGEVWKIDNDQRFGNTAAVNVLDQMTSLFRRSNVVLHTCDIKGLRSDVDAREGLKPSSNESLFLMANPTGGQLFKHSNDLSENFDRMLRQQQVLYLLGFQVPSPGNPGKFHNLKIRVKNVPGARVSHRAGYYEPSAAVSPLEQNLSAVEILMNDLPRNELALDMISVPFPADIGNPQVPVILEVGGGSILAGARGESVEVELFIYAFDRDAAVRDSLYQKVSLDLTKVRSRLATGGVKFYGALGLPPGDYDVKALARVAQSGRVGFERLSVTVPDFGKPALLPPIIVGEERDWIMIKAAPRRPAEVEYPFTIASESFVPCANASFTPNGSYEIALFGYHLEPEGLELSVRVRDQSGSETPARIVLVGRTPSGAKGPTKLLFNFRPEGLAAGKYALDFTIKSKDQRDRHHASVPFVVN